MKSKTSKSQLKRILNCIPSRKMENDWRYRHADAAGILGAGAIPPSKDLRAAWWKINDQGSTGSCVGWASADSVIRWHMVKANRLTTTKLLSARFQWMAAKETDEFVAAATTFIEKDGTSLKAALDVARKFGTVLDSLLPFDTGALYQGDEEEFYALAAQRKIASYFNLDSNPVEWRKWIATKGPIITRLDVDATWDNAASTQGNLDVYQPATVRGGHAVALVGYTPDRFIVRNSWGLTWGDKGFGYASLTYATTAFTESYGVTL
jgi:C1A family cysteine protease